MVGATTPRPFPADARRTSRSAAGSMPACHQAINDGEGLGSGAPTAGDPAHVSGDPRAAGAGRGPIASAGIRLTGWSSPTVPGAGRARRPLTAGCGGPGRGQQPRPGRRHGTAAVLRCQRGGPARVIPQACRARHGSVSRPAARRASGQSRRSCVARSPSQEAAWPMATTTSRQETGAPRGPSGHNQKETTPKCHEETCLQRRL
jgi:hypothetical protein